MKRKKKEEKGDKLKWTQEQKTIILQNLGYHIQTNTCPGKAEIEKLKRHFKCLQSAPWKKIKYVIHNEKNKMKQMQRRK